LFYATASPKYTTDYKRMIATEIGSSVTLSQSFYTSNLDYTSVNWAVNGISSVKNESVNVVKSNVTLMKNGKSDQFEGYTSSVDIRSFKEQDIGTYTVTVCNIIGCTSTHVNLTAAG